MKMAQSCDSCLYNAISLYFTTQNIARKDKKRSPFESIYQRKRPGVLELLCTKDLVLN